MLRRVLSFLVAWEGLSVVKSENTGAQPHIVYILADDLGWNDVSFHGYNEIPTPNIDRLAHEGVILNSHYSHSMCTPSRAALLTGKYATRTGMQHNVLFNAEPRGLPISEKLLPQYLKELGYSTHLVGKWHLGYYNKRMIPTARGFDTFFGFYGGSVDYFTYVSSTRMPAEYFGYDLWNNSEPAYGANGTYATDLFTEEAVRIIHQHDHSRPLFLLLSHLAPHSGNPRDPVQAPKKYLDRFPNTTHPGRKKYAATVSGLDDSVQHVYEALVAQGIVNNTIMVFVSDNGGSGAEKGRMFGPPNTFASNWPLKGAKISEWEGGVRTVAFLWSRLLGKPERVSTELFHITDWLPTFYRLAGGRSNLTHLDGHDIWNALSNNSRSPREEVLLQINPVWNQHAIRSRQFKLVVGSLSRNGTDLNGWYTPEDGIKPELKIDAPGALYCGGDSSLKIPCDANQSPCLFDVVEDPCEYLNIARDHPAIVDYLLQRLRHHNQTALPSNNLPYDPRAKSVLHGGLIRPWMDL